MRHTESQVSRNENPEMTSIDQNKTPETLQTSDENLNSRQLHEVVKIHSEAQKNINELNLELQKISNKEFLKKFPFSERLKHITDPHVNSTEVAEKSVIEFNFSFTGDVENSKLNLYTTAGQVLPETIDTVTTQDGKEYTRTSLTGEFFTSEGIRLIILDKTQITVGELRTTEEITQLETESAELVKNSGVSTDTNMNLLLMGASKGMNPDLVLKFYSVFFDGKEGAEITAEMQEDFLTQIDREIGYMALYGDKVDKNNLSEDDQKELLTRMGSPTEIQSYKNAAPVEYTLNDYPELVDLAKELGIHKPEFLFAIWELESSCGRNIRTQRESRGRESLGFFHVLNTNLPNSLHSQLKNNPTDRDLNIQALRHFIHNNNGLVHAINTSNFEQIASIYNGKSYDSLARRNGWTPYDDKLRDSLNKYYERMSQKTMAA